MADDYASIVEQAYLNETGRASDPEGAAYWTGLLQSGAITPADLSALFSGTAEGTAFDQAAAAASAGGGGTTVGGQVGSTMSPSVQSQTDTSGGIASLGGGTTTGQVAPTTAPEIRSFLEGQYQSEFGRAADAPGLDYWADQIQKGNITKEQVADIFSKSEEGLNFDIGNLAAGKTTGVGYISPDMMKRYTDLQSAYQTSLYRPGDVEGMKYFLANPTDYGKAIGGSDEAFVQKAYRDTLKYAPDAEGLKYWTSQLASGAISRANLPSALTAAAKKLAVTPVGTPAKSVVDPGTGVRYSSSSELAKAYNFGNFPLTAGTRTTEDGEVVPTVRLNLPSRPKVSLGIKSFAPPSMTDYSYDSASGVNLFGGRTGGTTGRSVSLFSNASETPAATQGNEKSEVVQAAKGGMISSDPVMRRAMFRAGGPVSSVGTGITSNVATPEENAKALQTMFAPGFRKGGQVLKYDEDGNVIATLDEDNLQSSDDYQDYVSAIVPDSATDTALAQANRRIAERKMNRYAAEDQTNFRELPPSEKAAEMSALERLRAQTRNPEPRFKPLMQVFRENRTLPIDREQAYTGRSMRGENVDVVQPPYAGGMEGFMPPQMQDVSAPPAPRYSAAEIAQLRSQAAEDQKAENAMYRQAAEDEARYRAAAGAAARDTAPARTDGGVTREPVKDRLTLRLEELKAEREANKEKRRENQLLALMQAGFAAAAGRSPNALANIAAGGISGVQTLAELNKDVRAEDRALRREILETELTQERMREAAAERRAAREQTAAERERTMLQTVSSNINNRLGNIRSDILSARTKLTPGIPEDQKREIEIEIANLSAQARAEQDRLDQLYDRLGIGKPRTVVSDSAGFKFLGAKK